MKLKLLCTILAAWAFLGISAQQVIVTGVVTDAKDGSPMPGVNVIIEGTTQGNVTDLDGKYSLKVDNANAVLAFSFLGYISQKIPVGSQTSINVQLSEELTKLDEVVVIGYGTTKKKDLTGSVSTLRGDDLTKAGASTPEQLLQGKVSGVQIISNNGEPGSGFTVRIRGASTIRSGTQPLYVIDGIPLDEQNTSPDGISGAALGGSPATSPLTTINPNDIESIDILKDASAAAIYGSRGANGVVLITTKKGKEGASEINYSVTVSSSVLPKQLEVLSGRQWLTLADSLGITEPDFGDSTNWQDQIFRTAISQEHNLSLSGGTAKSTYRASFGYLEQKGIIKKSDMTRYSGRLNLTQKALNNKLTLETTLSGSQVIENRGPLGATGFEGDMLLNALQANPTWPVRDSLGIPFQGTEIYPFQPNERNPVAMLEYTTDLTRTTNLLGGINASVEIIQGLNLKVSFAMNYTNANRLMNQSQKLSYMKDKSGTGQINNKEIYNYVTENTLNYNKTIGPGTINVLAGYSYQEYMNRSSNMTAGGFVTDGYPYVNAIQYGKLIYTDISSKFPPDVKMQSYFGRINYNLSEKYLVTATVRADGSSKFGKNKRYGIFPSFALGWRMSEEEFVKSLDLFQNLKLRFGWGQTGNSEIEPRQSQFLYSFDKPSKAIIGDSVIVGLKVSRTPNPDVTWETTTSSNIGVDFGVLKGKLSGSIDFYMKKTSDLLLQMPSLPLSPSQFVVKNNDSVKVENQGLELSLTGIIISQKDLSWEITGNISFLSNKVTGLSDKVYSTGNAQGHGLTGTYVEVIANNKPMNMFYGSHIDSIKNGNIYYLKSKVNTSKDSMVFLGNPQPKYTWSISNKFKYKRFDLSIFIEGVYGNKLFNNTALLLDKYNLKQSSNVLKYFAYDPVDVNNLTTVVSDRYIEDGSYVRLSSVTLGYNVNLKNNPWVKSLRFYVSGTNLMLFTDYKGYDPDVSSSKDKDNINSFGIDITNYPKARTYLAGLNVTF
jgi:TonB-dependent starch-binding outer membrane protein SusC